MFKLLTIAILVLCILFSIGVYVSPEAIGYADPPRTPTSTPENQDLVNLVNELIRDESCVLPCWWGWNIGEDNKAQIQRNAEINWGRELIIGKVEDYTSFYLNLNKTMNAEIEESLAYLGAFVTLWLDPQQDRLIGSRFYVGFPMANYADLEAYMIPTILSKYGTPNEVMLDISSILSPLELTLRYESLNLYIQYSIAYNLPFNYNVNDSIIFCNSRHNILELQLQVSISPEGTNLPEGIWGNPAVTDNTEIGLEEVSAFSLEEFTQIFSQLDQCFETLPISVISSLESTS